MPRLDRITVILVRARDPNNIGAVARAMYDFGFHDLRLVNEYEVPLDRARSAIDASSVLASARNYTSLSEATADCTLILGTTAVGARRQEHPLRSLAEAAPLILAELGTEPASGFASTEGEPRVALLFGSEKTGLSNAELSHCHWLLTIPMAATEGMRHASMNLGQAAAVCLYELVRNPDAAPLTEQPFLAPAAHTEQLVTLMQLLFDLSEYSRHHPAKCDEINVRRLILRMGLTASDARVWMGILRQLLWKLQQHQQSPLESGTETFRG